MRQAVVVVVMLYQWASGATILVNPGDSVSARIAQAQPGDTIQFVRDGNGKVPVCGDVGINKKLTLTGYLKSNSGQYAFIADAHDVTVTGLTLDGSLVKSTKRGFRPSGWLIVGNTFMGRAGVAGLTPGSGAVIFAGVGNREPDAAFVNCKITNNVFNPIESWAGIYLCGWQNVEIARNEFRNRVNRDSAGNVMRHSEGRCIKLFGQGADLSTWPEGANNTTLWPRGLWIHHNLFSGVRGMAIEKQDGDIDAVIEDNYYENPIPFGTNWLDNRDTWAFSIVSARAIGELVRWNYLDCRLPTGVPRGCFRVGIEGGGYEQRIIGNCIIGNGSTADGAGNLSIPFNGSNGTGTVSGNRIVNMPGPSASNNARPVISNNGPDVVLPWDITRPKPSASGIVPIPIPTIVVTAAALPDGSLAVSWVNGTGPFRISAKTSQGSDPWKEVGITADNSVVLAGGHSGWEYDIRVEAGSANGVARIRVAGDPEAPGPVNELVFKPPPTTLPTEVAELQQQLATAYADLEAAKADSQVKSQLIAELEARISRILVQVEAAKTGIEKALEQ